LYKDALIIIFDESFASLDYQNSIEIQKYFISLDQTLIAIHHSIDLEIMQLYDEIIFIEKGSQIHIAPYEKMIEENPDFVRFIRKSKQEARAKK